MGETKRFVDNPKGGSRGDVDSQIEDCHHTLREIIVGERWL